MTRAGLVDIGIERAGQIDDRDMQEAVDLNPSAAKRLADEITAMILTYNEESNIARTLDALHWVKEILIVDSGSTDATIEIVARYQNARVVTRKFDNFADQCNYGLSLVETTWVLSMDADYEVSPALAAEIKGLAPPQDVHGFRAAFTYRIYGRPLRATLYPPRVVLYRPRCGRYRNEGHGHRVEIQGEVQSLAGWIYHDDRKPLSRWLASQAKYAAVEAEHLLGASRKKFGLADRIRLMAFPAPFAVFFYVLLIRGCILDGAAGWHYAFQRMLAEVMLALQLIDIRLQRKATNSGGEEC